MSSSDKRALAEALEHRIQKGPGAASPELRSRAFEGRELPEPLVTLLHKVATRSFQLGDADFAEALAAGFSEDQLFELVICAAVGESARQRQAGLRALAEVDDR